MYTEQFHSEFESSLFFQKCKSEVKGKLSWHPWTECSKTCGSGFTLKFVEACHPSYAICTGLQVEQKTCNELACIYKDESDSPPGTIVSWVPKPNKEAQHELDIPDKWILCDGIQTCKSGM